MAIPTRSSTSTHISPAIWAVATYLVATGLGVTLRFGLAGMRLPLPFDHILHAHSHALYFGWAAMVILFSALPGGRTERWARAGAALVVPMTLAFLAQGYGALSIAASTLLMLAWYAAIVVWWRRGGDRSFGASLAYIVAASLGIWVLAALQATDNGEGLAARLAVHAFLSTFAWSLVLGTVALLDRHGIVDATVVRRVTTWWAGVAWLLFPLGVAGGPEVPILGWAGRAAALIALVPATWWVRALWRSEQPGLRAAAVWLSITAGGLAAVAMSGSTLLTWVGRAGIVFYLHALLLGYVTTVLVWHLGRRIGIDLERPLRGHNTGVAVMLVGIVLPLAGTVAAGNWIAAVGAVGVWVAGWSWATPLWRERP